MLRADLTATASETRKLMDQSLSSLLGIIINISGNQSTDFIGGSYWVEAGIFHNGFKGFVSCSFEA